jgi:hypothetical protein
MGIIAGNFCQKCTNTKVVGCFSQTCLHCGIYFYRLQTLLIARKKGLAKKRFRSYFLSFSIFPKSSDIGGENNLTPLKITLQKRIFLKFKNRRDFVFTSDIEKAECVIEFNFLKFQVIFIPKNIFFTGRVIKIENTPAFLKKRCCKRGFTCVLCYKMPSFCRDVQNFRLKKLKTHESEIFVRHTLEPDMMIKGYGRFFVIKITNAITSKVDRAYLKAWINKRSKNFRVLTCSLRTQASLGIFSKKRDIIFKTQGLLAQNYVNVKYRVLEKAIKTNKQNIRYWGDI